jgi:hypothetical protein
VLNFYFLRIYILRYRWKGRWLEAVAARGCLRRWGKKLRSGEANGGESGERELSGKCATFKFFWKFRGLKSKTGHLKKIIGGFEEKYGNMLSKPQFYDDF